MRRALCLFVLVTAAVAAAPADVSAQMGQQAAQSRRQYQGLFRGGSQIGSGSGHRLDISGGIGHGYDDDLRIDVFGLPILDPDQTPLVPLPTLRSGSFTHASGGLQYGFDSTAVSVSMSANGLARYYGEAAKPFVGTGSISGSLSVKLTERTSFSSAHNIGVYQQNLSLAGGLGGSDPFAGAPATLIDAGTYASAASDFSVGHRLTSRVSASAGYGLYWNDVRYLLQASGYDGQSARAGLSVSILRNLSVSANYRYTKSGSNLVSAYNGHGVDVSTDFGRALSLSRNSSIGFGVGVSGVNDLQGNTRYYATGHASYRYDIGRTWGMSAGYVRSVDFFQLLGQPVFIDSGNVGFGGGIGRRLNLNFSAGLVSGLIGLAEIAPRYLAGSGSVGIQIGLTRKLALGVNYSFYSYRIDENAVLPIGLLSRFDRQSVSLSMDVWLPVISGARRN